MSQMTISQALRRAKKLKGLISENLQRAQAGVSYRADSEPAFKFPTSMEKAGEARRELIEIEGRLAATNVATTVEFEGKAISLALAVRILQDLKAQIAWYRALPVRPQEDSSEESHDYSPEGRLIPVSVKWKCDLPEARRAEAVDGLQDRFDRLNDLVENRNHVTPLVA